MENTVTPDDSSEHLVLQHTADRHQPWRYVRSQSEETRRLGDALLQRHPGAAHVLITPSGMSAISVAVNGAFDAILGNAAVGTAPFPPPESREHVALVHADELYTDTPHLLADIAARRNSLAATVSVHTFDTEHQFHLQSSCRRLVAERGVRHIVLFVESCSNPHGYLFNWRLVPELRAIVPHLWLVVDNTWLTDYLLNPFQPQSDNPRDADDAVSPATADHRQQHYAGADIVVCSLTKHYSGGHAIAGAVLVNHRLQFDTFVRHLSLNGLHTSPHNAHLVLHHMGDMDERMRRSCTTTRQLLSRLSELRDDQRIGVRWSHPWGRPGSVFDSAFLRHEKCPPVLTIMVGATPTRSKSAILRSLTSHPTIHYKTSFGAAHTRFDTYPQKRGDTIHCRLAIGYDDTFEQVWAGWQRWMDDMH